MYATVESRFGLSSTQGVLNSKVPRVGEGEKETY